MMRELGDVAKSNEPKVHPSRRILARERHQAALSDLDYPPATAVKLARARRIPTVAALHN
jgi:hypothetical protein